MRNAMPSRAAQSENLSLTTTTVVEQAREIARTGDRWFLSVADGIGRLGDWALKEADIAADSAAAAFTTTVDVAKKLTGVRARAPAKQPKPKKSGKRRVRPDPERTLAGTDAAGLEVVPASSANARPSKPRSKRPKVAPPVSDKKPEPSAEPQTAGVLPLLQALGQTVADHTQRGYATLEQDERFWTLIHLLQLLSRPIVPPRSAAAPDLPSAESPDDSANSLGFIHYEPKGKP